jgi:hypothetical protein
MKSDEEQRVRYEAAKSLILVGTVFRLVDIGGIVDH